MTAPFVVLAMLAFLLALSHAEQAGARYWAPKAALYFKVAEDAKGRTWVRYVGKAVRPAQRQSGHRDQAARKGEVWRQGDMLPLRWCWTERQAYRIEHRRILALAAFYRHRRAFRSSAPPLENVVLNRKPVGLTETLSVYLALTCYVVESFVYPSRTWVRPRRKPAFRPEPVAPREPSVPQPALPMPTVVGPGRNGPRFAQPTTSWSVASDQSVAPLASLAPPPPVPVPLTSAVPSPAVPVVPRGAGDVNPSMTASAADGGAPGALPPPPPVPVRAKRPRRPRPPVEAS